MPRRSFAARRFRCSARCCPMLRHRTRTRGSSSSPSCARRLMASRFMRRCSRPSRHGFAPRIRRDTGVIVRPPGDVSAMTCAVREAAIYGGIPRTSFISSRTPSFGKRSSRAVRSSAPSSPHARRMVRRSSRPSPAMKVRTRRRYFTRGGTERRRSSDRSVTATASSPGSRCRLRSARFLAPAGPRIPSPSPGSITSVGTPSQAGSSCSSRGACSIARSAKPPAQSRPLHFSRRSVSIWSCVRACAESTGPRGPSSTCSLR